MANPFADYCRANDSRLAVEPLDVVETIIENANETNPKKFEESLEWSITRLGMTRTCARKGNTREELAVTLQAAAVKNEGLQGGAGMCFKNTKKSA